MERWIPTGTCLTADVAVKVPEWLTGVNAKAGVINGN